jgi:hypothetical protein
MFEFCFLMRKFSVVLLAVNKLLCWGLNNLVLLLVSLPVYVNVVHFDFCYSKFGFILILRPVSVAVIVWIFIIV